MVNDYERDESLHSYASFVVPCLTFVVVSAMAIAAAVRYSGVKDKLNTTKYWAEINGYNPPRLEQILKKLQEPLEIEKTISIDYNSNLDKHKKPLIDLEKLCDADKSPDLFDHPLVVQLTRSYALFKALSFARLNADRIDSTA